MARSPLGAFCAPERRVPGLSRHGVVTESLRRGLYVLREERPEGRDVLAILVLDLLEALLCIPVAGAAGVLYVLRERLVSLEELVHLGDDVVFDVRGARARLGLRGHEVFPLVVSKGRSPFALTLRSSARATHLVGGAPEERAAEGRIKGLPWTGKSWYRQNSPSASGDRPCYVELSS